MSDGQIKVIIKGDNADLLESIDESGDSLTELDKRQIKSAQQSLNGLNNTNFSRLKSKLKSVAGTLKSIGSGVSSVGRKMTAAFTLPIVALGAFGSKVSLELDKARTKMTALTGSREAATKKWKELNDLAAKAIGVTRASARDTFNQLKGLNIGDKAINALIGSLGKLNAAFDIEDMKGFTQNLNQIFSQGFERADIKEAIGRVPIFEELLKGAFGTSDGDNLRKLKESGKLTLDGFLQGISGAIDSDSRTANIGENLSTKLAKSWEILKEAAAPLGDVILTSLIPIFQQAVPIIVGLSQGFESLSPSIKTAIVVAGGIIAAIGPVLVVIGGLITAIAAVVSGIGTIVGAIGAIGGLSAIAPIILGVGAALLQVVAVFAIAGASAYTLYKLWESNFGGIRDFTNEVWNGVKSFTNAAMNEIRALVHSSLAQIITFWVENGEDITAAAKTTYAFLASIVKSVLNTIRSLWAKNGDTIIAMAKVAWATIKTLVTNGITIVLNVIKLVSAVINGDWAQAWEAAKTIIATAVSSIITVMSLIIANVVRAGVAILKAAFNLGKNIVVGILKGIGNFAADLYAKAKSVASKVLGIFGGVFETQSPSKATFKIGEFVTEGLALGMLNKITVVKKSAKAIAKEALKELKEAAAEFANLAGLGSKQVQQKFAAAEFSYLTSNLNEILELRRELGENLNIDLPAKAADIRQELASLQQQKSDITELADIKKQAAESEAQYATDFNKTLNEIHDKGQARLLQLTEERLLLRASSDIEKTRIKNNFDLIRLAQDLKAKRVKPEEIEDAVAKQKAMNAEIEKSVALLEKRKQILAAENFGLDQDKRIDGLHREIAALQGINTEITEYQKTLKLLERDYKKIGEAQKQSILQKAREIDALKEQKKAVEKLNEAHAELKDFFKETLSYVFEGDFKGLLKNFAERAKETFIENLSGFLATNILGFDPNKTDNPVAKPIVNSLNTTNKHLADIKTNLGAGQILPGVPSSTGIGSGRSGGLIGGILSILGIGGGRNGIGGTPNFNPNAGGGSSSNLIGTALAGNLLGSSGGSGNGGFLSNILGEGGIFGKDGFGNNLGTYSTLGTGVALLGQLIGGRAGSVLSGVGSGAATGAQIGSIIPGIGTAIGAGVGAVVGGIASLFGLNGQRRKDEETRNAAMIETLRALNEIKNNIVDPQGNFIVPPRVNLDSVGSQARGIESQYFNAMQQLKDKKTRNIALKDGRERVTPLASEIEKLALEAKVREANRQDTSSRFTGEFAGGTYMSREFLDQYQDFKRRNGVLSGSYTGRDYLPSLLGDGEMVLNPEQIKRVRASAGFDAFKDAGIPNYKHAPQRETPKFSRGVSLASAPTPSFNSSNNQRDTEVHIGDFVINLNGKRITDAEIESIAINGVEKFKKHNRRRSK